MTISAAARILFAAIVRYAGVPQLARATFGRRGVGIIVYHDPSPERIEAHLKYLHERYELLTLDELVKVLGTDQWNRVRRSSVVITFDDGHRGNLALIPVLERFNVRPIVYLTTGSIESGRFWFLEPGVDVEQLKALGPRDRRARFEEQRTDVRTDRHALSKDEVRMLSTYVDFGSHTVTHPNLPLCRDDEADAEIRTSREQVELLAGRPCSHFSYPNGDYSSRDVSFVRRSGYSSARTVDLGWTRRSTDPLCLPIISLADHASVNMLAAHLAGALFIKHGVRRARRKLSRMNHARTGLRVDP